VNYYLIILFSVSIFLSAIVNLNVYGLGISKIDYINGYMDIGFIPIKSKILPQYDNSKPQTENKANAQSFAISENSKKSNTTNVVASAAGVKILSPSGGKEIPVGNLTIFGISTDNEKSDCTVSVDWNNEKPFQKAKATGPYGEDDYSSWTYTYSASYHMIENGLNDLTSKLECLENSKVITKWHSINVTGVVTNDSIPSSNLVFNDPLGILPQIKTVSAKPLTDMSHIPANKTVLAPSKLLINMELSKKVLAPGDAQDFTLKISDSNSRQVAAANIDVKISQGLKILTEYNGTSDTSGLYTKSWNLNSDFPSGNYDVLVSASADGYEPTSLAGSFQVQRQMLVEASLLKRLVVPGDQQSIDVKVVDANTKALVSGANVMAKIGEKNEYNGTSDIAGAYSHAWNITSKTPSGNYDVLVSASADGYVPASITGSFQVQRQMLVEASLSKDPVIPGEEQTINLKVLDANTQDAISGANVMGKIGGKKFSEITDDLGTVSYSWHTPPTSGGNSYEVVLDVSSEGYPKEMKTISFNMDKPQNLLEPPISNYQNNVIKVKEDNNHLEDNLKSSDDSSQCTNLISNIGCDTDGNDKPTTTAILAHKGVTDDTPAATPVTDDTPAATPVTDDTPAATPVTDDTPAATPVTDDTPAATPVTDDTPVANYKVGSSTSADDQDEKNALNFLAPVY
jgi:hypothetical protein